MIFFGSAVSALKTILIWFDIVNIPHLSYWLHFSNLMIAAWGKMKMYVILFSSKYFIGYYHLVHAYRDALIPWNKNRISMAENDISPLKIIFHGSTIVFHWLMNGLLKISRYLRHHLSSAYRIFNIPAPFLLLLLWAARPDLDKSQQSSIENSWIK